MMARSGLTQLIFDVRLNCDIQPEEYYVGGTVTGVQYWSDDQIQIEMDRYRKDIKQELLHRESEYSTGTVEYKDYYWSCDNVEEYDASNAEIWHLEDAGGTVVGTADYTVNYEANHIRFSADTQGSAYYLSYRTYDIDRISAAIWKKKAAHVAQRFDLKTDNHDMKASQLRKQYMDMAKDFMKSAKPTSNRMIRSDIR